MTRYVLLRIEDDAEADELLQDIVLYPHQPVLTPRLESPVSAEIVPDLDQSDVGPGGVLQPSWTLQEAVKASYQRAHALAAEYEETFR